MKSRSKSQLDFDRLENRQLLASVTLAGTELTIRGDATDDVISMLGNSAQSEFTVQVNSDPSLNQVFQNANVSKVFVYAGDGNDQILNTLRVPSEIFGQGGDDIVWGGYEDDRLFGGDGVDKLRGRAGDDYLAGGDGDDLLSGLDGDDTIYGGFGNDQLFGDHGNDYLNGQQGDDVIRGGDGDDWLLGTNGDDELHGGNGNDNARGGNGIDLIYGGVGADDLRGNADDDTIHGGDGDDFVSGGLGDDVLYGNQGNDTLAGHAGDDTIWAGWGDDEVNGGSGNDHLVGHAGDDVMQGTVGDDYINGGGGNDQLFGQTGSDTLVGYWGDDLLDAGGDQNVDVLWGSTGFDTFVVHGEVGVNSMDEVRDRFGMETYVGYTGSLEPSIEMDGDTVSVVGSEQRDVYFIDGFANTASFHVKRNGSVIGTYATEDIDEVVVRLFEGDDKITTDSQVVVPLRVDGGDGNDFIEGGNGPDRLFGGAGNDAIHARNGDDVLVGGDGDDLLHGNLDNDQLFGGVGRDKLYGDSGDDVLVAGEDNDWDRLWGNGGFDQYFLELVEDHGYGVAAGEAILELAQAPPEPVFGNGDSNDSTVDPPPLPGTASIGDQVFEDLDADGVFDFDEAGVDNIVVTLSQNSQLVATQTTGDDGTYLFEYLAAGTYTIELQSDTLGTRTFTTSNSVTVTLAVDEQNLGADFGLTSVDADPSETGSIGDLVFVDGNEDGVFGVGDYGLANVSVRLLRGTAVIATQTNDSNENYTFSDLEAGTYQVELQTETLGDRMPTTAASREVTIGVDEQNDGVHFGVDEIREIVSLASQPAVFRSTTLPPATPAPSGSAGIQLVQNPNIQAFLGSLTPGLSNSDLTTSQFDQAYNCHSFAWHNSIGDLDGQDPDLPANPSFFKPFWDNSPIDDMANATLLGPNDIPQVGDIIVYVKDLNNNGTVDDYQEANHSAVVTGVSITGVVTEVRSKPGQAAEINHHPNDPFWTPHYGTPTLIYRK